MQWSNFSLEFYFVQQKESWLPTERLKRLLFSYFVTVFVQLNKRYLAIFKVHQTFIGFTMNFLYSSCKNSSPKVHETKDGGGN